MDILNNLKLVLEESKNNGEYFEKGIPSSMMKIDNELNKIIESYAFLSKNEKNLIRSQISTDIGWMLLGFSMNMATYSLRLSEEKYFLNGLVALGMILGILDQRELMIVMSLYYDVSKRNRLSFKMILENDDDFSNFVKDFLGRNEKDKTLECMGYILTKDQDNNPIYQRTW